MKRCLAGCGALILVWAGLGNLAPPLKATTFAVSADPANSSGLLAQDELIARVKGESSISASESDGPRQQERVLGKEAQDLWVRRDRFKFKPDPALAP